MKKGFVTLSILLFLALAGFVPVKADDVAVVTPYVDTPTLTDQEIFDNSVTTWLVEYLRSGGTIDVGNTDNNFSVSDLINDFGEFVVDVVGTTVDLINPFQSQFQWGNGYPLNQATPTMLQFMGLLPFYALDTEGEVVPDVPIDYASYIDTINGTGFFWKNYTTTNDLGGGYTQSAIVVPYSNYSWYALSSGTNLNSSSNNILQTWGTDVGALTKPTDIITFNINNNGDNTYSIVNSWRVIDNAFKNDWNGQPWNTVFFYKNRNKVDPQGNVTQTTSINYTSTLEGCLQQIARCFRNVNIYVDGVPWSIVGTSQSFNIELSTGTVTPQGERVRWMYDKEIYVDIDKILERLEDILYEIQNTPNTPTIIKFDDLDDLIVDVDGQPALSVKVVNDPKNIDEVYIDNYGPIVPLFVPLFTPVINDSDILTIATTPMQAIPQDIIDVFAYIFIGGLFVCFIHRLLE